MYVIHVHVMHAWAMGCTRMQCMCMYVCDAYTYMNMHVIYAVYGCDTDTDDTCVYTPYHTCFTTKIRTTMTTGLRARAIAFIQIQQPLRVATKSNKYGGGKAPTQSHMLPVWQRLLDVTHRMEDDPEFLFDIDYFIFDDVSDVITGSCKRYRETKVRVCGVRVIVCECKHRLTT